MNARLDENLDKAYEHFRQDHENLRNTLMASLSKGTTKQKRFGAALWARQFTGGFTMNNSARRITIAAAVVIAVLLGLHYLAGSPVGTTVAWADVLKNVEAAKTFMYTWEFEKGDEREVIVIRVLEPYLCRHDSVEGSDRHDASIMNTQTNKRIALYPRTKTAVIHKGEGHPGLQLRNYEKLKRDLRNGTEKDLGRIKLNGRDTICFEITRENQTTTVWADPNTALPIQIETISNENGPTRSLMSDIRFDVQLDERLFEPPTDYCVLDMETERWTTPFKLTDKHLLEGLAVYPKYLDGKFCTRYMGGRPLTDEVRKKCRADVERIENWSEEEAHQSTLGCAFIEQLPEGSDWQYVGEDVKLGDASKAVCWWKPVGSSTYRVVYGDLSVRDVAPKDLPPIPWLAEQK
jgi:outer membrane lipoprotein-sorting protein